VFSDHQVRSVVAKEARPRMSEVYACLGCSAQCGRCTHAIKRIMDERPTHAAGSIHASARVH
jgi:bacterioferritin-associated ferredoxin